MEERFAEFHSKKAFEISYALLRIAGNSGSTSFAGHLQNSAFNLLAETASRNYPQAILTIVLVEYLLRLGREASLVGENNAEVVLRELRSFKSAIGEIGNSATLPDLQEVDLAGIFSAEGEGVVGESETEAVERAQFQDISPSELQGADFYWGNGDEEKGEYGEDEVSGKRGLAVETNSATVAESAGGWDPNVVEKAIANRQSAILEKIRQSGNCKLKDIQESLPGASERTIRYDLQRLVERGVIERVGSGGPGTFYRTKGGTEDSHKLA